VFTKLFRIRIRLKIKKNLLLRTLLENYYDYLTI